MTSRMNRLGGGARILAACGMGLVLASGCIFGEGGGGGGGRRGEYAAMMSRSNTLGYAFAVTGTAGGTWTAGATSVAANMISSAPSLAEHFEEIDAHCQGYTGVTSYDSEQGVSPITMETSTQVGTATYDGSRYVISGLVGGPAFATSNDTLTISGPNGMPTDSIATPVAMTDPNQHFGAPNGLATVFMAPDGGFDAMYVFVNLTGAGTDSGVSCTIPAADMTLNGAVRSAPILPAAAITWITENGLTPTDAYVFYMRQKQVSGFFAEEIPLQAGQMFRIPAATLGL